MDDKKRKVLLWVLGAVSLSVLVSIGVCAAVNYHRKRSNRDPRGEKVNELLHEAEHLLDMGKRGQYYAKRNRG